MSASLLWISQNWCRDFSDLLHAFVEIESCYMDLSKLLHGFVKLATWICWSCYVDSLKLFYIFLTLSQAKLSNLTNARWLASKAQFDLKPQCLASIVPLAMVRNKPPFNPSNSQDKPLGLAYLYSCGQATWLNIFLLRI